MVPLYSLGNTDDEDEFDDNVFAETPLVHKKRSKCEICWERFKRFWSSGLGMFVLLLVYTFCGAAAFNYLEEPSSLDDLASLDVMRNELLTKIVDQTKNSDINSSQDRNKTMNAIKKLLAEYEIELAETVHRRGAIVSKHAKADAPVFRGWSFWGAFLFCTTAYTTIGYGHISPQTQEGRIFCMVYCFIGIPLCFAVLTLCGRQMTHGYQQLMEGCIACLGCRTREEQPPAPKQKIRSKSTASKASDNLVLCRRRIEARLYCRIKRELLRDSDQEDDDERKPRPARGYAFMSSVVILGVYVFFGAFVCVLLDRDWSIMVALYFTFTSMATIGFGDLVPDTDISFALMILYVIVGLVLVAMLVSIFIGDLLTQRRRRSIETRLARVIQHQRDKCSQHDSESNRMTAVS